MKHSWLAACLAGTVALGCGVKKEVHQKVVDELTATRAELDETRKRRDALAAEKQRLEVELEAARGNLTAAEREKAKRIEELLAQFKDAEAELEKLRERQERANKRLAAFRELRKRLRGLVDTGKLTVSFRNGQMVLNLPSGVLFPSGQADLSKNGEAALAEILGVLGDFKDRRFLVAGHTDNVPIKKRRFPSNWHLSTARAVSVVTYMIDNGGFDPKNVGAAGYGEWSPVASNETDEGRQQNRRIEIILVPDLSELPNLPEEDNS
jgi:chemotaxis protein MotB